MRWPRSPERWQKKLKISVAIVKNPKNILYYNVILQYGMYDSTCIYGKYMGFHKWRYYYRWYLGDVIQSYIVIHNCHWSWLKKIEVMTHKKTPWWLGCDKVGSLVAAQPSPFCDSCLTDSSFNWIYVPAKNSEFGSCKSLIPSEFFL